LRWPFVALGLYMIVFGLKIYRDPSSVFWGAPISWAPYNPFLGVFLVLWGLGFIYFALRRPTRP
jgi:hypothetical protein